MLMKPSRTQRITFRSFLLLSTLGSSYAQAALIAYEPFDYPPSSNLSSNAGRSGWIGSWIYNQELPCLQASQRSAAKEAPMSPADQLALFFRIDFSYSNGNCSTQADPPLRLQERLQHRQGATGGGPISPRSSIYGIPETSSERPIFSFPPECS